jgi:hypothetical protein
VLISNPAYEEWYAVDQQVLVYLLLSLSKEIMGQVTICTTAASAWGIIEGMYTSGTRPRSVNIRIALATMKRGNDSIIEYISKARTLSDDMSLAGKKIDDEELISYIPAGLDFEYNSMVSALVTRPDEHELTIAEVYSQLLSYEQRMDCQRSEENFQASANAASRGRGQMRGRMGGRGGRTPGRGRGCQGGCSPSFNGRGHSGASSDTRPHCQVCFKRGHLTGECWHRFGESYVPEERYAGTASSYASDPHWYLDTSATDHVTGELEKMAIRERYKGKDQIHGADGLGMKISHIGYSVVDTTNHQFLLNNVLHVPQASKNLISVYRLTKDNSVFFGNSP